MIFLKPEDVVTVCHLKVPHYNRQHTYFEERKEQFSGRLTGLFSHFTSVAYR